MRAWIIALFAVAVLLSDSKDAAAQEGYYLELHGGANFTHDGAIDDFFFFENVQIGHSEFEAGHGFGGAVGYSEPGWRTELEVTYRRNAFERIEWSEFGKSGVFETDGDISSVAFMINGYWDIPTGTAIIPYLGGGIGGALVEFHEVSDADGPLFDGTEAGLALQLGTGVGFALTDHITLSLDYRFFFVGFLDPVVDSSQPGIGGRSLGVEYTNSSLWAGLRFTF